MSEDLPLHVQRKLGMVPHDPELKWWQYRATDRFRHAATFDGCELFSFPNMAALAVFRDRECVGAVPYGLVKDLADERLPSQAFFANWTVPPDSTLTSLTWDEVQP